ncbi:hypothetical protein D5086_015317 [Populus alba]|uniref:Uncharacterized protein n=1 Tax=Populus alba TaxID=43335 RepID=A0ACC4C1R7_POPAL
MITTSFLLHWKPQKPTPPSTPVWPTIDGPLGLIEDESLTYACRFYKFGFAFLPWLWAVCCFYFWPVPFDSRSFPRIRPCRSASSWVHIIYNSSSFVGLDIFDHWRGASLALSGIN